MKLPADADMEAIKTKLEEGVLKISIPRIAEMRSTERVLQIDDA